MKKKSGFTLAEVLITLAIIGVVAAIMLPAIKNAQPNKEMALVKKAYYNTTRLVSELINDEDFYPEREDEALSGFSNVSIIDQVGDHEARFQGREYSGPGKFCGLFAAKINTVSEPNCNARVDLSAGGNFRTPDGIIWSMPVGTWANGTEDIYVDVNGDGPNRRPNCTRDDGMENAQNCADLGNDVGPDQFLFRIHRNGRVELISNITRQYISSTHVNWPYKEFSRRTQLGLPIN